MGSICKTTIRIEVIVTGYTQKNQSVRSPSLCLEIQSTRALRSISSEVLGSLQAPRLPYVQDLKLEVKNGIEIQTHPPALRLLLVPLSVTTPSRGDHTIAAPGLKKKKRFVVVADRTLRNAQTVFI